MITLINPRVKTMVASPQTPLLSAVGIVLTLACGLLIHSSAYAAKIDAYEAQRFLSQASFGATAKDIQTLRRQGYERWIDRQIRTAKRLDSSSSYLGHLALTQHIATMAEPNYTGYTQRPFNQQDAKHQVRYYQMAAWWEHALGGHPKRTQHGKDQLRQRVAYSLSQLFVVSPSEALLKRRAEGLAHFYDLLVKHSFGNFRDLMYDVSTSPAMGVFLSHNNNRKAQPSKGTRPDENYARELMQLFSIGLYELNIDGSYNTDGNPNTRQDQGVRPVAAYTQTDVEELAKILTGWTLKNQKFGKSGAKRGDYTQAMQFFAQYHEDERAEKGDGLVSILGHTINLRQGSGVDHLNEALDILFYHPNIAPHISKHMIQRMVTSNPSPDYIARVAAVFENNGKHTRGDMQALIKAVLLDPEARNRPINEDTGQIKEPLLAFTQFLRALNAEPKHSYRHALAYWYLSPTRDLGQGPLRSPTVFNFYSAEYIPNDDRFKAAQRSAPEMEIQHNSELLGFNNQVFKTLYYRNRPANQEAIDKKPRPPTFAIGVNLAGFLTRLEKRLEGDHDGDFLALQSPPITPKHRYAINELIAELTMRLGIDLPPEQHQVLAEFLLTSPATRQGDPANQAERIVTHCAYFLATSPQFRVLR